MRDLILKAAADLNADLVGFAPASRFDSDDVLFQIMPDVKTVIGLGFRVLRGLIAASRKGAPTINIPPWPWKASRRSSCRRP